MQKTTYTNDEIDCDYCQGDGFTGQMMSLVEGTSDFHDPSKADGHGQITSRFYECDRCHNTEDYIPDEDEWDDQSE
jgi:hypothetical protein